MAVFLVSLVVFCVSLWYAVTTQALQDVIELARADISVIQKSTPVDPDQFSAKVFELYEAHSDECGTEEYYALFDSLENDPNYLKMRDMVDNLESDGANLIAIIVPDLESGAFVNVADGMTDGFRMRAGERFEIANMPYFMAFSRLGKRSMELWAWFPTYPK